MKHNLVRLDPSVLKKSWIGQKSKQMCKCSYVDRREAKFSIYIQTSKMHLVLLLLLHLTSDNLWLLDLHVVLWPEQKKQRENDCCLLRRTANNDTLQSPARERRRPNHNWLRHRHPSTSQQPDWTALRQVATLTCSHTHTRARLQPLSSQTH